MVVRNASSGGKSSSTCPSTPSPATSEHSARMVGHRLHAAKLIKTPGAA